MKMYSPDIDIEPLYGHTINVCWDGTIVIYGGFNAAEGAALAKQRGSSEGKPASGLKTEGSDDVEDDVKISTSDDVEDDAGEVQSELMSLFKLTNVPVAEISGEHIFIGRRLDSLNPTKSSKRWNKVVMPLEGEYEKKGGRAFHSTVLIESDTESWMFRFGGKHADGSLCSSKLCFLDLLRSPSMWVWVEVPVVGAAPERRFGHSMSYLSPYLVVFGGYNGEHAFNDTWILDVSFSEDTTQWQRIDFGASLIPLPRCFHAAASVLALYDKKSMIIYGGVIEGDAMHRNRFYALEKNSMDSWNWTILPFSSYVSYNVSGHSMQVLQNLLFVMGGFQDKEYPRFPCNPVKVYNFNTFAYEISKKFCSRVGHQSWVWDGAIYSWGGFLETLCVPASSQKVDVITLNGEGDEVEGMDLEDTLNVGGALVYPGRAVRASASAAMENFKLLPEDKSKSFYS